MSARDEPATLREALLDELDAPGSITKPRIRNLLIRYPEVGPPTITTAEELDALPVGAVVLDLAEWLFREQLDARYVASGSDGLYSADAIDLPATVLYEPTTPGLTAHQEGTR